MYNFLFIIFSSVLLFGCTHNQQRHLTEIFTAKTGSFEKLRDAWIVEESLGNPSQEFTLSLDPSFILKGDRLPQGERFIFAVVDPVTEKIDVRFEFEVFEDGDLCIYDQNGTKTAHEIPFVAAEGLVVGKPIIYTVVSKEKFTSATAEFNPYPLEYHSENGAGISLKVSHPMLTRFQLQATGFAPQERVTLIHESGTSKEEIEMFADEQGNFSFGINPTVIGRMGGEAALTVKRGEEEFHFDYPWGTKLEKKTFEERTQFPILFVVNREFASEVQITGNMQ